MTPWTVIHQAPLSMRFPRQEYWSGLPFSSPENFSDSGTNLHLLHWQVDSLLLSHEESPVKICTYNQIDKLNSITICLIVPWASLTVSCLPKHLLLCYITGQMRGFIKTGVFLYLGTYVWNIYLQILVMNYCYEHKDVVKHLYMSGYLSIWTFN